MAVNALFKTDYPAAFGRLGSLPRVQLFAGDTTIESMPNLSRHCGGANLLVKRDDCNGLAFGGNKVRQLEFYIGAAVAERADTILITGAVQSNFTRIAAAAARKMGMDCHIQQEERVLTTDPNYRSSGNAFIARILGATLHSYPDGEDETGADRQLEQIATELQAAGRRPYVIHLGPDHPPLGALGYVAAAHELLRQIAERDVTVNEIFLGSGSGATQAGLLFGLRALGSEIPVTGVCVRRNAELQKERIVNTCEGISGLLDLEFNVCTDDIVLDDNFLAAGYGLQNKETIEAINLGARQEGMLVDPVYTAKVLAATVHRSKLADEKSTYLFWHTGGTPALFAYPRALEELLCSP